jgi:cytochrome c oxidase cbb3-type subunit II
MMFIRLWLFFLGVLATVFLGWAALVGVPGIQIGAVPPQPALRNYTFEQAHGREIYIREGCIYCHTQQTRPTGFGSDQARRWGRASVPGDYFFDRPHLLGTSRTGPDLFNIGVRQPSRDWHMSHLYNPRSVMPQSVMPPFPWLFEEKTSTGPLDVVVDLPVKFQPRAGVVIVAGPEAVDLVNYLLGMDRSYRVRE